MLKRYCIFFTVLSFMLVATGVWAQDEKAKVSSGDSTPDFLMNKFQAGTDIELTESGTSNRIIIIGRKPVLTTEGDLLTHDGNKEVRFGVGADGEVLTADSTAPNGIKWGTVPAGAQGIQGEKGDKGDKGDTGDQGIAGVSGKDDADGVEITFTREFQYDPGTGAVNAIDINGTALVINQTDPTVTLGGEARSVLATADIPNTTPQLQQVVIDMPASLLAGNYKLKLSNTQGNSESVIPLIDIVSGNDSYTKLLLHSDGTGATFTDSSASSHSITANGNATQSPAQSQFGGKSALFDGSGDYLSIPSSDDWAFGTGDFTIDFWIYPLSSHAYQAMVSTISGPNSPSIIARTSINGSQWSFYDSNGSDHVGGTVSVNQWTHYAVTREGTTGRLFINGNQVTTWTDSNNYLANPLNIGYSHVSYYTNGYIEELRVSKGVARWTGNFTPPTAPY